MVAAAFNCPSCGGALSLRAPEASLSVACEHCGSVLDAQDPKHRLLSKYKARLKHEPYIPLGKRGKIKGEEFEAIGFMRRRVRYYGTDYEWSEYLLHNPYKGFRWLLEYNGHWTFLSPLANPPEGRKVR